MDFDLCDKIAMCNEGYMFVYNISPNCYLNLRDSNFNDGKKYAQFKQKKDTFHLSSAAFSNFIVSLKDKPRNIFLNATTYIKKKKEGIYIHKFDSKMFLSNDDLSKIKSYAKSLEFVMNNDLSIQKMVVDLLVANSNSDENVSSESESEKSEDCDDSIQKEVFLNDGTDNKRRAIYAGKLDPKKPPEYEYAIPNDGSGNIYKFTPICTTKESSTLPSTQTPSTYTLGQDANTRGVTPKHQSTMSDLRNYELVDKDAVDTLSDVKKKKSKPSFRRQQSMITEPGSPNEYNEDTQDVMSFNPDDHNGKKEGNQQRDVSPSVLKSSHSTDEQKEENADDDCVIMKIEETPCFNEEGDKTLYIDE